MDVIFRDRGHRINDHLQHAAVGYDAGQSHPANMGTSKGFSKRDNPSG